MILESILIPTVVVPLALALGLLFISGLLYKRKTVEPGLGSIAGVAVALAFLSGFVAMTGWPRWPPVQSTHRLFFAVVAAALLGLALNKARQGPMVRFAVAGVGFLAMLRLLLHAPIENSWTSSQTLLWLGGLTATGLLLLWAIERSLQIESTPPDWSFGSIFPAALRLTLLGLTATTLGLSETARLAQLLGAAACGVAAVELSSRLFRRESPAWQPADALPLTTVILGLLVCGHFYAELSMIAAVLIVASFAMVGILAAMRAPDATGPSSRHWFLALAVLPLLAALAMTGYAYVNQPENPYLDYYPADE